MAERIKEGIVLNLFWHELRSRFGTILGWGIGLALFGAMNIGVWPDVGEQMGSLADLAVLQAIGFDLGSFTGFVASAVIGYIPLILGIYAIIASTGTLAGEEDDGTLELIVAAPLSRWQIVTVKAVALQIAAFLMIVIAGLGNVLTLEAIRGLIEVDVTSAEFFVVTLSAWPITGAFIMMGLFLGAFLPSRRTAALTMTLIFIASYFGLLLVRFAETLQPFEVLSLFNYFDFTATAFTEGPQAQDVGILLGVALVFFVLALLSFRRRNVTVGAWPWQRARVSG
jgi:ABC-2 type transport system permease protein